MPQNESTHGLFNRWISANLKSQAMQLYQRHARAGRLGLAGLRQVWNAALLRRSAAPGPSQAGTEASDERFRLLFEQSRYPALLMEGERFVAANRASLELMHIPRLEDFLQLSLADISPPCQPDGQASAYKAAEMMRIAHKQGSHDFEWEHLRADGTTFTASTQLTSIQHREQDLLYVLWRDISAQKRTACELAAARETAIRLEQQQRLSDLLEQDIVGVAQTDAQYRYTLVNDRYCAILGRTRTSLLGQQITAVTHPANREFVEQLYERVQQEKHSFVVEQCFLRADDIPYWLQLAITVSRNANGNVESCMLLALDISERKQQEKAWHQTAEILRVAERAAGAGAWRWDCIRDRAEWSPEMFRLLGLDPNQHCANLQAWLDVLHPADRDMTRERLGYIMQYSDSFIESYRILRPDGEVIWIDCHGQVKRNAQGRAIEMAGVCIDASPHRQAELLILQLNAELEAKVEARTTELLAANEALRRLARHDALTGLPNRLAANERRHQEFVALQRSGHPYSVLLIDIDRFKRVNDSFGHAVGDRVLQQVGRTLAQSLRESDFVARWGGEEFLVLLPATDLDAAKLVAEKLRQAVESCPDPDAGSITISLGLALATASTPDQDMPLREADACLYVAKREGRNRVAVGTEEPLVPVACVPKAADRC